LENLQSVENNYTTSGNTSTKFKLVEDVIGDLDLSLLVERDELLDLIVYHIYKTDIKEFDILYPLVNLCIMLLKGNGNGSEKKYKMAERFMLKSFKFYFKQWVGRRYDKIEQYFSTSVNGTHLDLTDVYQDLFSYFFELIEEFDHTTDVYFVIYLRTYLSFWLSNKFKMNKKEMISQVSLEKTMVDSNDDGDRPITYLESIQTFEVDQSSNLRNQFSFNHEDVLIDQFIVEKFEKEIMGNSSNFKNETTFALCQEIYNLYFKEKKHNKSDIARHIGVSQQKVRYYLDKILRMLKNFFSSLDLEN
jgi:hypothetical protein